ncbi:universal stress protein uspa-like protein [Halogeometricum pallidum JCM 14848]|uniref:Universal stress protein uspa-like protein n=1 Tax=Halogeometricum pallidum JCM 14848 TaxID=1227487 RepID=M0CUX2_HALPD|nr:universal stress protein [Halogeometricum pallidum]ELZ26222.1 universal stress protein uspa-like protein [Halogeometricum pallidum JCM 14848]
MYERILVPVDGSEGSEEVLYHAGEMAQRTGGEVTLLFVADTSRDSVTVVEDDVVDALEQEGSGVVDDAAEVLDSLGVGYSTDVVQGDPVPTIVDYAERYDYDAVVMPTQGKAGLSKQLLGSVTEKVVRLSERPVVTVRTGTERSLSFPYERVLVATDGSSAATYAAEHAVDLAASLDATLHVLSVVDDSLLGLDVRSALSGAEAEEAAEEAVENVVIAAESRDVEVETHVEHGSPHEAMLDAIESYDIDAVVMGTTGKGAVDRILLGSVAEKTVRTSPVPVVTVHNASE